MAESRVLDQLLGAIDLGSEHGARNRLIAVSDDYNVKAASYSGFRLSRALARAGWSPRFIPERQGGGRRSQWSVERDDNLAVGTALLDVRQGLEGLVERERLVDDRAQVAGVVEGGQLAQLGAVGLHEQERVAHA
jgi:hypothetical protein